MYHVDGMQALSIGPSKLFTHTNVAISDKDECTEGSHGCMCVSTLSECIASCRNEPGGYSCGCSAGYALPDPSALVCDGESMSL